MKYNKIIFCSILIFLFSCNNENTSQLESNKIFTQSETKEIIKLLQKFDTEICKFEKKENEDFSECYQSFFERILKETEGGNYNIGIDKNNQLKIVESLSPDLKKEFWIETKGVINRRIQNSKSNEIFPDSIQFINISKGKYFEYLEKEISQIDSKTAEYFEKYSLAMTISPSVFSDVIVNYKDYNIKDDRIRLLIAIHYLTLNDDNLKRKESYERLDADIKRNLKREK